MSVLSSEGRSEPLAELQESGLLHAEVLQPLLVIPLLRDDAGPPVRTGLLLPDAEFHSVQGIEDHLLQQERQGLGEGVLWLKLVVVS